MRFTLWCTNFIFLEVTVVLAIEMLGRVVWMVGIGIDKMLMNDLLSGRLSKELISAFRRE